MRIVILFLLCVFLSCDTMEASVLGDAATSNLCCTDVHLARESGGVLGTVIVDHANLPMKTVSAENDGMRLTGGTVRADAWTVLGMGPLVLTDLFARGLLEVQVGPGAVCPLHPDLDFSIEVGGRSNGMRVFIPAGSVACGYSAGTRSAWSGFRPY